MIGAGEMGCTGQTELLKIARRCGLPLGASVLKLFVLKFVHFLTLFASLSHRFKCDRSRSFLEPLRCSVAILQPGCLRANSTTFSLTFNGTESETVLSSGSKLSLSLSQLELTVSSEQSPKTKKSSPSRGFSASFCKNNSSFSTTENFPSTYYGNREPFP